MAKNTSISLGDRFDDFIETQVKAGRYRSADEVIHAGLRLLEEHEIKVKRLQTALIEGEESGPAVPFDFDAFNAHKRAARGAK